jgi:hypothetical protein
MPRPRHRPKPDRRRALELLASCRDGCTEAMMLAHGFTIDMMVELVNAGLATATAERAIQKSRPHRLHFFARRITRPVPRSPEILGHARSSRIFPQDPLQLLRAEIER